MTKEQFERAKASPDRGVLVHLICNDADDVFFSDDPDALSVPQRTVLAVETFFSAVCDGGFAAWFDLDHGKLACCGPKALRRIGLPEYAALADEAIRLHHQEPVEEVMAGFGESLDRIRSKHEEEDPSDIYIDLDAAFFARFHDLPGEFRDRLHEYIVQHEEEFVQPK